MSDLYNPKNVAIFTVILDEEDDSQFSIIPRTDGYQSREHIAYALTKAQKSFEKNGILHPGNILILKTSLDCL